LPPFLLGRTWSHEVVKEPTALRVQANVTNSTLRPRTDPGAAVIDGAKCGDQAAFAFLIKHYDPGLRSLAYRLLGDPDRMDDALQEAYVKAFRSLSSFRGQSRLGTWLYRIVYNACLDELKRGRRFRHLPLDHGGDRPDPRADIADTVVNRSRLAQALSELALEDRAAVLLVDAQGFDYRSAGEVLGVPEGTVASRLNRARAALRRALGEQEEGVPGND
jgi:RNA polymerase sigma-70 factor (ECF subfamily)